MKTYQHYLKLLFVVAFSFFLHNCASLGIQGGYSASTDTYFKDANALAQTYDKEGKVDEKTREKIFQLYTHHQWKKLESLINKDSVNGGWPPADGGFDLVANVLIKKGKKYDRYSNAFGIDSIGNPILGGSFTSPFKPNGQSYAYGKRALRGAENTYDFYFKIEVLEDVSFTSLNGTVIPWFGQPGLGVQAKWAIPVDKKSGYPFTWTQMAYNGLIKLTIVSSPSGKYPAFKGKVISKK